MLGFLDPLAPMGDQYQISPPIIHKGLLVDPIPTSLH